MTRILTLDLPDELREIRLYPVSDLHDGDRACDMKLAKEAREKILNDEDGYCFLNGDLFNNALVGSVSNVYNDSRNPEDQFDAVREFFFPLVKAGKILGGTGGNHEYRSIKTAGIDLTRRLFELWGIGERYCENEGVIKITLGKGYNGKKICYLVYFTHGSGGGSKPGSSLNRLVDLSQSIDCDVYIVGHAHKKTAHKNSFRRVDSRNNIITEHERLYVVSSSFTSFGGYAARGMMTPSAKGSVPITLSGNRKEFYATV